MNYGYDTFVQSYPNTMRISSVQAPQVNSINFTLFDINTKNYSSLLATDVDSRHFTPLDIYDGSSEHPSANKKKTTN